MSVAHSTHRAESKSKKQFFSYAAVFRESILWIALNVLLVWLDVPTKTLWIVLGGGILVVIAGKLCWRIITR
ncbi:MAG TPA: hypothetical protein VF074_22780 [Pyrinomonadaceae bacterium]